jgi:sugar fermentation stimulation protein A
MFPDAVTERGRRHLEELAHLAEKGHPAAVMFLVHTPRVDWFMPDFHTDPAFAETLVRVRDRVRILPVSLHWTRHLRLRGAPRLLDIPWHHIEARLADRGAYLLILRLPRRRVLDVGSLGRKAFAPGYYVYVGSAMRNLSARIARHTRLRKRKRWHIDFLRSAATECVALPIRTPHRLETPLAVALGGLLPAGPAGFGASDSPCTTHLFHSATHPLHIPAFHAVLERFRMQPPG